ncbi:MAG TPA: hypothetical protein VG963_24425 [Polyangiaceae bacterium]|nr:hypothetical protein [Polyangiaceae bacterium]
MSTKPKIDLKARLGQRRPGTPASASIPPPVGVQPGASPSAVPVPQSVPSGYSSGYPGVQSQRAQAFDALGVASVQAPPAPMMRSAPVINTAELEAEMRAVQRGGRGKVMALAAGTAVVGGLLGFAIGGLMERNSAAETAVVGAKALAADVDKADAAVAELSKTLEAAAKSLKEGKYPEAEVKALGGINIPFDGSNLAGKGIGRFKPQLVTSLINYAGAVTKANTQKDKVRSLLSVSKAGVEELLAQSTAPQVRWGVSVQSGPQGPWGSLQLLSSPFPAGDKGTAWPAQLEAGEGKNAFRRYTGGDPSRGEGQMIPIAPQTQNNVCPTDTIVRLRRELTEMQKAVNGDSSIPGQETQGIAELGESIKKQLAAIGG